MRRPCQHQQLATDADFHAVGRALGTHRLDLLGVLEGGERQRADDAIAVEVIDPLDSADRGLHRRPVFAVDRAGVIAAVLQALLHLSDEETLVARLDQGLGLLDRGHGGRRRDPGAVVEGAVKVRTVVVDEVTSAATAPFATVDVGAGDPAAGDEASLESLGPQAANPMASTRLRTGVTAIEVTLRTRTSDGVSSTRGGGRSTRGECGVASGESQPQR